MGLARAITVALGVTVALKVFLGAVPAHAVSFLVVAPGDPISGMLVLDPSTPLWSCIRLSASSPFRTAKDNARRQTFAAPIVAVFRSFPAVSEQPLWQAAALGTGTVNGEAVPYLSMGVS